MWLKERKSCSALLELRNGNSDMTIRSPIGQDGILQHRITSMILAQCIVVRYFILERSALQSWRCINSHRPCFKYISYSRLTRLYNIPTSSIVQRHHQQVYRYGDVYDTDTTSPHHTRSPHYFPSSLSSSLTYTCRSSCVPQPNARESYSHLTLLRLWALKNPP